MKKQNYLSNVRNQYEDYPYPQRDPQIEKGLLRSPKAGSLDTINHYCFSGKKDFSKGFRVLVPGGGTGDTTIYLAEQLRDTDAEIVYLDMSEASLNVARQRAELRGLKNITWIHESILNIPELKMGVFDFITCTGVLHHLADPQAGLNALKSVLASDGSIYLMLYGTYGRTGVYQIQELMRRINAGYDAIEDKINNTKAVLKKLPGSNWFNFNMNSFGGDLNSDIGIYDLLLHEQDVSYSIPELYEFVEASGLQITKLFNQI